MQRTRQIYGNHHNYRNTITWGVVANWYIVALEHTCEGSA